MKKAIMLALAVGVAGSLAACDTLSDGGGGSSNSGLFGSSGSSGTYGTSRSSGGYGSSGSSGGYGSSGSSGYGGSYGSSSRGTYADPCDPRNVSPGQRATILHQDRPGGSDCGPSTTTRQQRY